VRFVEAIAAERDNLFKDLMRDLLGDPLFFRASGL
jgi:hypothetical protein